MTPQEIAQVAQQSEKLKHALRIQKQTLWRFLRGQIDIAYQGPQMCESCTKIVSLAFSSPYAALYTGWCLECVLRGFWDGLPYYEEVEAQRRDKERRANAVTCWIPPDEEDNAPGDIRTSGAGWLDATEHDDSSPES